MKRTTMTAVSNFNNGSHNSQSYLGGQHRHSTSSSVAAPPPFYCSSNVLLSHKISARSLNAMAVIMAKLSGDLLISHALACDFHWRRSRLHTRIYSDSNAALSSPSPHYYTLCDESIIQNSSFRPHSTRWDASVPLFCKFFCVLLGHGCTSCYVFFCPSIPSLVCHLLWLRNQIVGRAFPSTPFLCSTRSHWSSLFIGDVVPSSALAQVPTCFLTETVRQVEATDRHNRRGGITRTGDKEHTRTVLQNAANFPKVVFTTNNQMIQQCIVSSVPVQHD